MTRDDAFNEIASAQAEFDAARFCIGDMAVRVRDSPAVLRGAPVPMRPSHIRATIEHLECTYLLRLFAE